MERKLLTSLRSASSGVLALLRTYAELYFPVLVLIFSGIAAAFVFGEGHFILEKLRDYIPSRVSDRMFLVSLLGIIVMVTQQFSWFPAAAVRESECQQYSTVRSAMPLTRDNSGSCPVCQTPLTKRGPLSTQPTK